jgi:hypothetical protein
MSRSFPRQKSSHSANRSVSSRRGSRSISRPCSGSSAGGTGIGMKRAKNQVRIPRARPSGRASRRVGVPRGQVQCRSSAVCWDDISWAMKQAATSTQQPVAAISPLSSGDDPACSSSEFPLQHALNALQYLQALHSRSDTDSDGWTLTSEKGFPFRRKLSPEISASLPIYKGERAISRRDRGGGDELRCADAVGLTLRWRSCVRGLCRRGWSTHGVCGEQSKLPVPRPWILPLLRNRHRSEPSTSTCIFHHPPSFSRLPSIFHTHSRAHRPSSPLIVPLNLSLSRPSLLAPLVLSASRLSLIASSLGFSASLLFLVAPSLGLPS